MDDITPFLPRDTVAFLRIADEDRRFPFRAVPSGLFLIGEGAGCDLRLGHDGMPGLHSVLQVSDERAEINRVAEFPEVFVNGESVRNANLADGDLIEIGDVRFVFQLCRATGQDAEVFPIAATTPAAELVSEMESELTLIEALQQSGSERIHELLRAAQEAVEGLDLVPTFRFSDYKSAALTQSSVSADSLGPLILSRFQAQESRLNEVCQVLEQVVKQQQLITTALQCVVDRIDELKAAPNLPGALRASA